MNNIKGLLHWLEISRRVNQEEFEKAMCALGETEDDQVKLHLALECAFRSGVITFCTKLTAAIQAQEYIERM